MIPIGEKTTSIKQHHSVTMGPKNWKLGERSEHLKCSVSESRVGPKLRKLEGFFFLGREYGELGIKNSELYMKQ